MPHLMILCLFLFFSVILAAPLDSRTVFDPPITSPTAQSIWKVGEVQTVTWNATGIPAGVTGKIMLGYLSPDSEGEHLSDTLASGFNLTDEKVKVTVPAVVSRTSYIVVLFGDSGNISPEFTIQGLSSSSASATSSKPSSASTGSISSPTQSLSNTPSPPISASFPASPSSAPTSSAPISTATAPSSGPASSSSLLPTSTSPVSSPSPSPSNNAGWSMNTLKTYQVMMTAVVVLLLI
ncbi:hypothetical protein B0H13DRAFT_1969213 [Mycena leptocephala]|nr:hypothetical protein B0H13DRAFT_1969213 [Mycena leptocephala]